MEGLKPPAGLDLLHGNLSENWRRFQQRFELYLAAVGGASKPAKVQSALFLHVAGEEAVEVYNTFTFGNEEEDKRNLTKIMEKFEEYCNPKKNITYERYKFFTCVQGDMSISQYVTELKLRAKSCEFGQLQESLIRDVCGITSDTMRERTLREVDIALEKAAQLCLAAETTKAQIKQMHEEEHNMQASARENTQGIGCLEGEHTIRIDKSVTPKVHPPRKIPVTLRERLKTELNRMEKMKVIAKIEEPTQWVNPIVIEEKPNGKLRICLDPRDLNTAVMREHYQLPTVEEVTSRL
ncbi:hypothetical protein MHYP_G00042940 [Metynnis hypsauchen]